MAGINRDLERYLRQRRTGTSPYNGPSWFDKMFSQAENEEAGMPPAAKKRLESMEEDIGKGNRRVEMVQELEEDLEEQQEERVGFYHKVMRFFQRPRDENAMETVEVPEMDDSSQDDMRRLAEIQVKWLSLLPLRHRQEFKESEDFKELIDIYEKYGVARRK